LEKAPRLDISPEVRPMPANDVRKCLYCGMETPIAFPEFRDRQTRCWCLKCDEDLLSQSDGSIITRDIAHHQETLHQASVKMIEVLQQAWEGYARGVRFIVGGGRIREEVLSQCEYFPRPGLY